MRILVCQHDKSQDLNLLVFKADPVKNGQEKSDSEIQEGMIICSHCQRWYPIIDGILIMLPDGLRITTKGKIFQDVTFLDKWRSYIPKETLEKGLPTNLSQKASLSLLEKRRSLVIFQHENLSDRAAKQYQLHELMNPATRYVMRREEELVNKAAESVVDKRIALDLGCGTGRHMLELSKRFETVVGIDFSRDMVQEAKRIFAEKNVTNVELIVGDAEHLMFLPETFSLIVASFGLLSFLFNYVSGINEICKTLKIGGGLYATVYNRRFKDIYKVLQKIIPWRSPLAISWSAKQHDMMIVQFGKKSQLHSKPFKVEELRATLNEAGIDCDYTICTPVVMPILPRMLLTNRELFYTIVNIEKAIDRILIRMSWLPLQGAYILVRGKRESCVCPPHEFSHDVVFSKAGFVKEELVCSRCSRRQIVEYSC